MTTHVIKCSVCAALLDEEDLFCPNCGTEAPPTPGNKPPVSRLSTHNFECQSCGASMSYDASAGNLRCPFCGSVELTAKDDKPMLAPELVVPFAISRDEAVAKMREWLGQGFWRPGDLSQQSLVVSMTAVYVPYWVFDATTHTYWTADTSQVPMLARGTWFPMSGEHQGQHSGLLIGASGVLTASETAAICPFDLASGVPPDQVDLENVIFEQFSVNRKYSRPLAYQALEGIDAQICQEQYVPGNCRNMKVNVRAIGLTSQAVLLPVWIMAYRYQQKIFRFLVNGQTGTATGVAPLSWRKIAVAVGIAAAVVFVILLAVAGH